MASDAANVGIPDAAPLPSPVALYVGDLHPDVTDSDLVDFFADMEGVVSVHACRDHVTARSLCYGYVNFKSDHDASKAMAKKNHMSLKGRPIRIMVSCRDPDARKSGFANLFVKNLVDEIDSIKLQQMFESFGVILSCKVSTYPDGKSRGYGFVQFGTQDSANMAMNKLNGLDVQGKQICVAPFVKKSERVACGLECVYTNLYMKNLDNDITEDILRLKFSEFGKITSLVLAKDADGNSKGFAFINYENHDNAKVAVEKMNGIQLGSKVLYVTRAQKKSERLQILRQTYEEKRNECIKKNMVCNVYVKHIDEGVDDHDLLMLFGAYGTITSAKVMRNDKGISKGFGFVCFSTAEEAAEAVKSLNGDMFHGKPLYVTIAQRKDERKAQLQLQFAQHISGFGGSSVIPPGYPFYVPSNTFSHIPLSPRPSFMYTPMGMRPAWGSNGFVPPRRPTFHPMPIAAVSALPRHYRQTRGRVNGQSYTQAAHMISFLPNHQQASSMNLPKDSHKPQLGHKNASNGNNKMNNGSVSPHPHNSQGTDVLSTLLAAASPRDQKQMLGERLYPLVEQHKGDLASKITGMLLEMDNAELLLLLDSPDSLVDKIEEAVLVLKMSDINNIGGNRESLCSKYVSAEDSLS